MMRKMNTIAIQLWKIYDDEIDYHDNTKNNNSSNNNKNDNKKIMKIIAIFILLLILQAVPIEILAIYTYALYMHHLKWHRIYNMLCVSYNRGRDSTLTQS